MVHFTRKPLHFVVANSLRMIFKIPPLTRFVYKSYTVLSVSTNPHFWLLINPPIFHCLPSSPPVHHHQRWVSSDMRNTCPEYSDEEEEKLLADEDPKSSDEDELLRNVESIAKCLHAHSLQDGMARLNNCGFIPSPNLLQKLLCRIQSNWKAAFNVFQWAGSQANYRHSVDVYHTMISILAMHKKFGRAWGLIRAMHEREMVSHQTLQIMIQRYVAAQDVHKAVRTFHAMERFKLAADYNDFLCLLRVLCRYQHLEEAEELIYFNKIYFPLKTESFNVLLHGWSNILVDVYQLKRLWKDMYNLCITPDVSSYTTMILCLSKEGKFYDVVRLYDEMKKVGFNPDLKVYNAVIDVLVKEKCLKEALHLFNKIQEMDFNPNAETYATLIYPLCLAREVEEAYRFLTEMIQKGFAPTIRIYHAFFRFVKSGNAIFEIFGRMIKTGCAPNMETYLMSIRRCCSWGEYKNAFMLWKAMEKHGFSPDHNACIILLNGFFLNGTPEEACKCYKEMKAGEFSLEPNSEKMFEIWIADRIYAPL